MKSRVLIVDDDETSRGGLAELMQAWGYEVDQAAEGKEGLERALLWRPRLVVADLVMPGMDGLELLRRVREELPATPVVLLTGHATVETAVAAMKDGAYDYITKPLDLRRVRAVIEKALEQGTVLREVTLLRRQLKQRAAVGPLVGPSAPMQEVFNQIELAAPTVAPVLILGESGVGKELVARTIHELSPRRGEAFVAVNCSAVPEGLLESELLGHEKGAFTGAVERRAGYFELADRGTIFLDEIAEVPPALQAKYLRILQDGMVRRVGGRSDIRVDVRILSATNKEPIRAIRDGSFRDDLYYRLNVFTIHVPPLRQRKEDIPALAEAFIREFNVKYGKDVRGIDDAGLDKMAGHRWPGNVRELRNCLERAVIAATGDVIAAGDLGCEASSAQPGAQPDLLRLSVGTTIDEGERQLILRTLAAVNNNKTRAAQVLKISLKTLHNKLHRYASEGLGMGAGAPVP
jgi:DNA-binding NtrC family response regulator